MSDPALPPHVVNRTGWPPGPWDGEPDRIEWKTESGFTALIVRNRMGNLCGYVGVEPGHPWHGKAYGVVEADVHGGLTYAGECAGHICHVPAPGEPEHLFWFGFDCAHAFDRYPAQPCERNDEIYRDVAFVRAEVEKLAEQARAASTPR